MNWVLFHLSYCHARNISAICRGCMLIEWLFFYYNHHIYILICRCGGCFVVTPAIGVGIDIFRSKQKIVPNSDTFFFRSMQVIAAIATFAVEEEKTQLLWRYTGALFFLYAFCRFAYIWTLKHTISNSIRYWENCMWN